MLEPSVAAYHLAFREDGVLLVTAPTTSSNQSIFAVDPDGSTTVFYRGLGRPQGHGVRCGRESVRRRIINKASAGS